MDFKHHGLSGLKIIQDNLSPEDLLALTNAITISLSKNKTADELFFSFYYLRIKRTLKNII